MSRLKLHSWDEDNDDLKLKLKKNIYIYFLKNYYYIGFTSFSYISCYF